MASEYPRRHIWTGDDGQPLTHFVTLGDTEGQFYGRYLTKAFHPGLAIAAVLQYVGTRLEGTTELQIEIRPLTETEVKKNNLRTSEVFVLDDLSYINLTENSND